MEQIICLFDVDGTLTRPRQVIDQDMLHVLERLQQKVSIGLVGGSDFKKISEQLGGIDNLSKFQYVFSENGVVCHKFGQLFAETSISAAVGEDVLQSFINHVLRYLSALTLPCKRGTFVEYRTGMINVSPIGRNCSQKERDQFELYDQTHKIRQSMIDDLRQNFGHLGLSFAIGGQISFDVFPNGWDKRYCLRYVKDSFKTIHFYGDKTFEGGNDHEIFCDDMVIGHHVNGPSDTKSQLMEEFGL